MTGTHRTGDHPNPYPYTMSTPQKPTVITTHPLLDALPHGQIIKDATGTTYRHDSDAPEQWDAEWWWTSTTTGTPYGTLDMVLPAEVIPAG